MKKAIVVLSGGQDSTTCLHWALANSAYSHVSTLTFDYGQRHVVEVESAKAVYNHAKALYPNKLGEFVLKNIPGVLDGTSPLTDNTREVESYASVDVLPGGLEKTFVPGRNILFLLIAANVAYCSEATDIITGVSQEDFGGYPDCRQSFISALEVALREGLDYPITLVTPLINLDKQQTVDLALSIPNCYDALRYSHTCYKGLVDGKPCGTCHSCLLRIKGFRLAGVVDPALLA